MTKKTLFFVGLFFLFALAGCNPEGGQADKDSAITNLGEEQYMFPSEGGDALISFKSLSNWSITSSEEWIFIGQQSGSAGFQDVEIVAETNETGNPRSALITVASSKDNGFSVLVEQQCSNVFIISAEELRVGSEGGTVQFTVTANVEYEVTTDAEWVSVVSTKLLADNTVTLDVQANSDAGRVAKISVKSCEGEFSVKLIQDAGATDKISIAELYYYGDIYGLEKADWSITLYNEDYIYMGANPCVYVFDILVEPEYDFFKVEKDGLPDGKYSLSNSGESFTFTAVNSKIENCITGEVTSFTDGEIEKNGDEYNIWLIDANDIHHKLQWTINPNRYYVKDKTYTSTVKQDYEVTFANCTIAPKGQYFLAYGHETYQTHIKLSGGSPQMGTASTAEDTVGSLLLSSATEDFTGTYEVQSPFNQTFDPGTIDSNNSKFYSTNGYSNLADGTFVVVGGTVTVTKDGDEYVVEGVLLDDYPYGGPHKLTIHARGVLVQ